MAFELFVKNECLCKITGQDVAIVAFGDHLSGKTRTIYGKNFEITDCESYGIVPRAISYIFGLLPTVIYFDVY